MAKKNWALKNNLESMARTVIQSKTTEELLKVKQFIEDLLNYKKIIKLDKTFIQGPIKAIEYNNHNKIYCDFNLDGTVTGRLSCSKCPGDGGDMGISFHTLPKKDKKNHINIRDVYVAEPGHLFLAADYSTMELRVLAQVADVKAMKESFQRGEDLHTDTASKIYNLDKTKIAKDSEERLAAKLANFLIVYGGQAPNLAESIGISMNEAKWIIKKHSEVYPEIEIAIQNTYSEILEKGYVETIFGRRRHLPNIISPEESVRRSCIRQGFNTKIQGAASDILLCADEGIRRDFIKYNISRSRTLANVHDSYEATVHLDELEDVVSIVYNNMLVNPVFRSLGIKFDVPLEVEIELGKSFGSGKVIHFDESGNPTNLEEIKDEILNER